MKCLKQSLWAALLGALIISGCVQKPGPTGSQIDSITPAERQAFLDELRNLPTHGEFYTDEAVDEAAKSIHVLLAVTEDDLKQYAKRNDWTDVDAYPLLALSAGLAERKVERDFVSQNFRNIKHRDIKSIWAALLFNQKEATSEMVEYLRGELRSPERSRLLSGDMGAEFENFKRRVEAFPN